MFRSMKHVGGCMALSIWSTVSRSSLTSLSILFRHVFGTMPLPSIQKLLRHKDAAVTLRYIGQKPDYDQSTLANYVQIG